MNVTAYFERRLDFDKHGLADEYIFDSPYDTEDDGLIKLDQLAGLVVPDFKESFYGCVNIDFNFLIHFLICELFSIKFYSLHVINPSVSILKANL